MRNLRRPGELIGLGFGGVVAWAVTFAIAGQPPNEVWIFELATAAGYGLAGFACWRSIVGNWKAQADKSIVRGPSRLMAAAAVVTAAGVARVTYGLTNVHLPSCTTALVIRTIGSASWGLPPEPWVFFSRPLVFGLHQVPVQLHRLKPQPFRKGSILTKSPSPSKRQDLTTAQVWPDLIAPVPLGRMTWLRRTVTHRHRPSTSWRSVVPRRIAPHPRGPYRGTHHDRRPPKREAPPLLRPSEELCACERCQRGGGLACRSEEWWEGIREGLRRPGRCRALCDHGHRHRARYRARRSRQDIVKAIVYLPSVRPIL